MIKLALVGDVMITRKLPLNGYDGLKELISLINDHEVKFANLETTVHNREGYPSAFPGGTWAMTEPACLKDLNYFGFNILNTANNHSMDYSYNGLVATHRYLREYGLSYTGTGENLADAAAPTYIECSCGRIAVIGATSSFHDSDAAGNQRMDMKGRPGVNPLRHKSVYEVTGENYSSLQRIAKEIGINDYHDQAIKEGFLLPGDFFNFANFEFKQGENNILHTCPLEKDLDRITKSITDARKHSDYVIVSIHSHQFSNNDKKNPAEFIRIFSKSCIDAGASVIVGHGPHIVRGIEVYNKGVIFYSLGNFLFQNETVSHLPADFYEKYSLKHDDGVGIAMDKRNKNGTIGLHLDEDVWNSVLVSIEINEGAFNVKLIPIELGFEIQCYKRGFPKISTNERVLRQIKELSANFGTEILIENGIGSFNLMI